MVNNFSVDWVGLYVNWANISLFIILGKFPNFSVKFSWLQRKGNKLITKLFDRYLQNCS